MEKAFQFEGVTKEFTEFKLGPLDFDLEPGSVLGYIGPNGSGKSTTMHCLVGLLKADNGRMKIFGKETNPNNPEWKFDIGYVGDKHVFYENWTGEKNLKFLKQFYPAWSDQIVEELITRFDLKLDKKAKELSSGNRVKLSLISALAHKPRLLILDEPTSGLDPVVRTELLDVLFEVIETGERSIFYSTHILSDISRIADELAFIDEGQIKLRTLKDDLTDNWRKISFSTNNKLDSISSVVNVQSEGAQHKIISSNYQDTINSLREISAENITETRMTIDEIAVKVIKGLKTNGEINS